MTTKACLMPNVKEKSMELALKCTDPCSLVELELMALERKLGATCSAFELDALEFQKNAASAAKIVVFYALLRGDREKVALFEKKASARTLHDLAREKFEPKTTHNKAGSSLIGGTEKKATATVRDCENAALSSIAYALDTRRSARIVSTLISRFAQQIGDEERAREFAERAWEYAQNFPNTETQE